MTTWLLLRGWGREAAHWGGFPRLLQERLPAGDRILLPDLPGNGVRWRERSASRIPDAVDALRAGLHADGEVGPFVVVALSLGAMVALAWSQSFPAELQGCVVVNCSMRGMAPFWRRLRPASYPDLMSALLPGKSPLARERIVLGLTSNVHGGDAALAAEWARLAHERPVAALNAWRQLLCAVRFRAARAAPPVPLLVLASEADRLVSVRCSRELASRWSVPLRVHSTAGHDLPLDAPEWLAGEVVCWWESHAR